jgi:hypothetical protein
MIILVLADDDVLVVSRVSPNREINRAEQSHIGDMDRTRIEIGQRRDQASGEIFIKKELRRLLSQRECSPGGARGQRHRPGRREYRLP